MSLLTFIRIFFLILCPISRIATIQQTPVLAVFLQQNEKFSGWHVTIVPVFVIVKPSSLCVLPDATTQFKRQIILTETQASIS